MSGTSSRDGVTRLDELGRHGHAYGELRLAIAFTDGISGDPAKRVSARGWDRTEPLPDGPFGDAMLRGRGATRNPAVVLRSSGLLGIDVDGPEGVELLMTIVPEGMPCTITVETGKTKGFHLWYRRPPDTQTVFVELGPEGIRAKTGQYLVCPPAIHPSGRVYRFAEGRTPWDLPLAVLPGDVLERLERAVRGEREQRAASTGPIVAGGRHDHLMRLGCAMRRHGACLEAVEAALTAENTVRCQPPKPDGSVRALAQDLTRRYGPAPA